MTQVTGSDQLRALAARLKEADDGKRLKKKLYDAMNESVKPLAAKVASVEHLKPYMPDRYALVLAADLTARISKLNGPNPRIEVIAKARQHKRKIRMLDAGIINHPVFARGPRNEWRTWVNGQTSGMRAGFFSDVVRDAKPQIRDKVLAAMTEVAREIAAK